MARLSRPEIRLHEEATRILAKDVLSEDDKEFVIENWRPDARHMNSAAGAFFTPPGLARDTAIEVGGGAVVDLCAGIGALSLAIVRANTWAKSLRRLVCVEINPDYVAVGRKLVPEAEWILADVRDEGLIERLGRHFDTAVSNPPFGRYPSGLGGAPRLEDRPFEHPRFQGRDMEFVVADVASRVARYGVFILPQASSPFAYSGRRSFAMQTSERYEAFSKQTGIEFGPGCGIDAGLYANDWKGVSPSVEVVVAEFGELRNQEKQRRAATRIAELVAPVEEPQFRLAI